MITAKLLVDIAAMGIRIGHSGLGSMMDAPISSDDAFLSSSCYRAFNQSINQSRFLKWLK